jgi:hypothetical protein
MRSFFPILILMILTISCLDQPDCIGLHNDVVGFSFKNAGNGTAISIQVDSVIADNAVIAKPGPVTSFSMPINYYKDQTSFKVYIGGVVHNLTLGYKVQTQFITTDCGERFQVSSLEVKAHDFERVSVVNGTPGASSGSKNLEIFIVI